MLAEGRERHQIRPNDRELEESQPATATNIQEDNANYFHIGSKKIEKRIAYQLVLAVIATLIIIALATAFFTTFHW
ncbi:unnamed protein product [Bursaphelenchus okinawaensis]|uniref:Uncharacterized protein n=1 Tax=Bursaphelenchus okinawaensis TaxID=465554 RepID=A0A811LG49_9BILA|nr:unnamed protein product [Bursaphelenchus okinawaensis]CAG9124546.1 unnamed protein product [Bursaphelenchus okinawaensis]